jgi:hypothetical protein
MTSQQQTITTRQVHETLTHFLPLWKKKPKSIDYENTIIFLDSPEGQRLLSEVAGTSYSQYKVLSQHFEAQKRGSFCSLASSVIVLNALFSSEFSNAKTPTFSLLTQDKLWEVIRNPRNGFLKREEDMRYGLTLSQVASMLQFQCKNTQVTIRSTKHFNQLLEWFIHDLEATFGLPGLTTLQQQQQQDRDRSQRLIASSKFQVSGGVNTNNNTNQQPSLLRSESLPPSDDIRQASSNPYSRQFIIVNFWRNFRQHAGGFLSLSFFHISRSPLCDNSPSVGHVTPLAAYHPIERMVLILETNQKRASHHWINIDVLTLLMSCIDRTSNQPRGYLLVSRVPTTTSTMATIV